MNRKNKILVIILEIAKYVVGALLGYLANDDAVSDVLLNAL